nr:hypothetical protein [Mesorhizobium sp.]
MPSLASKGHSDRFTVLSGYIFANVGLGEREPIRSDGHSEHGKQNAACNQEGAIRHGPAIRRAFWVDQPDMGIADTYRERQLAAAALAFMDDLACRECDVAADGFDFNLGAPAPQPCVDRRDAGIPEDNVGLRAGANSIQRLDQTELGARVKSVSDAERNGMSGSRGVGDNRSEPARGPCIPIFADRISGHATSSPADDNSDAA